MISWIQQTFQHHFRTIFAVLLGLIIVSFIFVTNASSGFGRAAREVRRKPFFDLDLNAKADQQRLGRDANISLELNPQNAQFSRNLEQYALSRYAELHLANQLRTPGPTSAELVEKIKTLRMFAGADGKFEAKKYEDFRKNLAKTGTITESDISRVLSDDIRAERIRKLVAGPGYVLPYDVKKQVERNETSWTIAVASIDRASFAPTITPTETDLSKFFEEYNSHYTIPERVTLSYANFAGTDFLAAVNVTEVEIRAFYDANAARFPKPSDKADDKKPAIVPAPANPAMDYPLVRPEVERVLRMERAGRLAAQAASDLSVAVFERKLAPGTPELGAFLAERRIILKNPAPFTLDQVPAELGRNPQIPEEALKLNKDRVSSDPIPTETGTVVLFWKNTEPSRQPQLAEVRAAVAADFIDNEKRRRFSELGKTLRTQLQTRVKAGESFDKAVAAATAAASVKSETKTLPAFTLRQPPQGLEFDTSAVLETLKQGDVSEMSAGPEKGFLVFAQEKKVPVLDDSNPQFAATRANLSQIISLYSGHLYFAGVVAEERAKFATSEAP